MFLVLTYVFRYSCIIVAISMRLWLMSSRVTSPSWALNRHIQMRSLIWIKKLLLFLFFYYINKFLNIMYNSFLWFPLVFFVLVFCVFYFFIYYYLFSVTRFPSDSRACRTAAKSWYPLTKYPFWEVVKWLPRSTVMTLASCDAVSRKWRTEGEEKSPKRSHVFLGAEFRMT